MAVVHITQFNSPASAYSAADGALQIENTQNLCTTVAHSGKQHAYWHALAVQRCGRLDRFITSGYFAPDRWRIDCCLGRAPRVARALERRRLAALDSTRVVRRWRFELPEIAARATLGNGALAANLVYRRDAVFDRWVARRFASRSPIFWGFQGSCLESLRAARAAGRLAVAEFAIAHVTAAVRILAAEAERQPEWAATISNFRFPAWYRERLEAEPAAADICIAASGFTQRSLEEVGIPPERIRLLPLGADLAGFRPAADQPPKGSRKRFRVLFCGSVGGRKGIGYLLEAYRRIAGPDTELVLCGPLPADTSPLRPYESLIRTTGRVDQSEVVREMREADVLVLPSVFEGFGLVIVEAMATGLPVIASTHSAAPEVIREGVDGFVLAPDDVDGLAGRLQRMIDDRGMTAEMGRSAAERAQHYSWDAHAERVRELLEEFEPLAAARSG